MRYRVTWGGWLGTYERRGAIVDLLSGLTYERGPYIYFVSGHSRIGGFIARTPRGYWRTGIRWVEAWLGPFPSQSAARDAFNQMSQEGVLTA